MTNLKLILEVTIFQQTNVFKLLTNTNQLKSVKTMIKLKALTVHRCVVRATLNMNMTTSHGPEHEHEHDHESRFLNTPRSGAHSSARAVKQR